MSYAVFEDYQFNPSYAYNPHHHLSPPLAHEEFFPDQPRSNPGRHHASFSQYDGSVDYHYDSQYAANTTRRLTVNYHPTTVSASAIEDNRGSYSPVSSPTSRHSDNLPSSPTSRLTKQVSPVSTDDRAYCPHPDCTDPRTGTPIKFFSRKADVARHVRSAHERRYIDCPFKRCVRKGDQGFTRNDHLVEHRRQFHMERIPKKGGGAGEKRVGGRERGRHDV